MLCEVWYGLQGYLRGIWHCRAVVLLLTEGTRLMCWVWLLWQLDRFAVVFRFLLVNTAMRFFKTSLFSTENVWALKVSAVLRLCIPILRTIACLVSVTVRHLINFLHTRVTRNLTSNAAYFKDLTKKWYVLFAYGTTSKCCYRADVVSAL